MFSLFLGRQGTVYPISDYSSIWQFFFFDQSELPPPPSPGKRRADLGCRGRTLPPVLGSAGISFQEMLSGDPVFFSGSLPGSHAGLSGWVGRGLQKET